MDKIFTKIAEALLIDYSSIYYVNAVTNEYQWYSNDPEFHSLHIAQHGEDFFNSLIRDVELTVYEEDRELLIQSIQKDRLLAQMKKGAMQTLEYRLMIDGKPVYHTLRLIRGLSEGDDYFIFGVINIEKEVRRRQKAERLEQEREIFNQIAARLAAHYDTLYYISTEDNSYFEFSSNDTYKSLHVPESGSDFFTESRKNISKYVHPDDLDRVLRIYYKDEMLRVLEAKPSFSSTYRLIMDGKVMNVRCSLIWASDRKHIIVCLENINDEVAARERLEAAQRQNMTYSQIAESLASNYDVIYYVNGDSGEYVEYTLKSIYGKLEMQESGNDFFGDCRINIEQIVHQEDKERVLGVLKRDYFISVLEDKKHFSMDYRLIVEGKSQYTRLTVMWSSDRVHFIIAVENIDEEIKKEKERAKALSMANELARRDELTGTRNKNAYHEMEGTLQNAIDGGGEVRPFAVVVCDINGLKIINDTKGHKAGDEYIRSACQLICNIFAHSPVFRIGGDEFVAILGGGDYQIREELLDRLHKQVMENLRSDSGPVVASGMAVYSQGRDTRVSEVFDRADSRMYEDKLKLKEGSFAGEEDLKKNIFEPIPVNRRRMLDSMFEAFSILAEGAYVYLCDIKYDFSRWSKTAVEAFGLPSEYMYGAGGIWEDKIHPEDRVIYHEGINEVFTGSTMGHDMQYRAKRLSGEYDVCTCRGTVLKDNSGELDYFCGTIRNHTEQGNIDNLTGLRNQYGFFEDIQNNMLRSREMRLCMIGISKFSDINEVYGYSFGNIVLQKFGRYFIRKVGNSGRVYRMDGTKFAILTNSQTADEIRQLYEELRTYFREQFTVDDRNIILDLNAGLLKVDSFGVDHQTIYACLNFAYTESKTLRQGALVEFQSDSGSGNKQRIEKLHAIRNSIMNDYEGFFLLYQPVVDAQSERLVGAEALLRWRSEEYGIVPPDDFIPLLERDTLFPGLGEWTLRKAIQESKKVLMLRPDYMVNVNLSYTQLEKADFVDSVMDILREERFPPKNLCLEITERCRLLDMDLLKNIVVQLRSFGIRIALDDFGTGFSSIGVVKGMPLDIIKIDRSFVKKIEDDEKEKSLIRYFIEVAATFGAKVCIEGIETAGMRDILQNFSVHSFQGFYFGKPLFLEELLNWKDRV